MNIFKKAQKIKILIDSIKSKGDIFAQINESDFDALVNLIDESTGENVHSILCNIATMRIINFNY